MSKFKAQKQPGLLERIQKLEGELKELRAARKKFLKTYRGVVHEDASSEAKYIKLKILDGRIRTTEEAIFELEEMKGLSELSLL